MVPKQTLVWMGVLPAALDDSLGQFKDCERFREWLSHRGAANRDPDSKLVGREPPLSNLTA